MLPACVIFGVTGISRAGVLVTDIQDGYFDRLLLTPIRRLALLLGMMVADIVLVATLTVPVIVLGLITGVHFETGILGLLGFIVLASFWGLVFTGFPYAIALKTGNPAAVNTSFLLFFPFAFLTTSFVPREALSAVDGHRRGLEPRDLCARGLAVADLRRLGVERPAHRHRWVAGLGVVSMGLCFGALRGRLKRN